MFDSIKWSKRLFSYLKSQLRCSDPFGIDTFKDQLGSMNDYVKFFALMQLKYQYFDNYHAPSGKHVYVFNILCYYLWRGKFGHNFGIVCPFSTILFDCDVLVNNKSLHTA